ncbi:hypothetical protein [Arcticibacter eurypsychrophilus]|uniref:hypothetical protein n=1 Tax=Arcticibacter eurypsychrophilus TaxID=1434752 RepID=UPI00084DA605|nr:hypothetical protein [Arcticibacter eurypsychrophilus]
MKRTILALALFATTMRAFAKLPGTTTTKPATEKTVAHKKHAKKVEAKKNAAATTAVKAPTKK